MFSTSSKSPNISQFEKKSKGVKVNISSYLRVKKDSLVR